MNRSSLLAPLGIAAYLVACGGSSATGINGNSSDSGTGGSSSGSSGNGGSGGSSSGSSGSSGSSPDSGGPVDSGGADAAAFNVAGVSGLVLWLDAAKGVTLSGNAVTAWADQSGNNNNAAEGRAALQPAMVNSGIHSLPAVSFGANAQGGSDLIIASSASLGWGTGDFLVEVVAEYNNVPQSSSEQTNGYGELYTSIFGAPIDSATGVGLYANAPPIGGSAASTAFLGFATGVAVPSSGTGYNDGAPHAFAMQRVGTTFSVRLDGVSVGSKTIGADVDVGASAGAHLGGIENATVQELSGEIAEVIAVKGTIAGDLAGIEGYLVGKYGLP